MFYSILSTDIKKELKINITIRATGCNHIAEANSSDRTNSLKTFGYDVADYHSVSNNPAATRRCAGSAAGIQNGNEDDTKGLINFLRGEDYFDYDGDCNLTETRRSKDKVYWGFLPF